MGYQFHQCNVRREKPRSGELFIEPRIEFRSGSSFRSGTGRLSPINGLIELRA
jgi:hypothetical protein